MYKNDNELAIFRKQIEQTNKQGEFLLKAFDEITTIKNDMIAMRDETRETNSQTNNMLLEIKDEHNEFKEELEEFKNTVTLSGPQADRLHKFATTKGHQLTKEFFGEEVSQELYMKKFGHLIMGVYTAIKKRFEVSKYTLVKRVQAEQAIAFVESLTLNDLPQNYKRLTDSQIDTATRHGDYGILERLA